MDDEHYSPSIIMPGPMDTMDGHDSNELRAIMDEMRTAGGTPLISAIADLLSNEPSCAFSTGSFACSPAIVMPPVLPPIKVSDILQQSSRTYGDEILSAISERWRIPREGNVAVADVVLSGASDTVSNTVSPSAAVSKVNQFDSSPSTTSMRKSPGISSKHCSLLFEQLETQQMLQQQLTNEFLQRGNHGKEDVQDKDSFIISRLSSSFLTSKLPSTPFINVGFPGGGQAPASFPGVAQAPASFLTRPGDNMLPETAQIKYWPEYLPLLETVAKNNTKEEGGMHSLSLPVSQSSLSTLINRQTSPTADGRQDGLQNSRKSPFAFVSLLGDIQRSVALKPQLPHEGGSKVMTSTSAALAVSAPPDPTIAGSSCELLTRNSSWLGNKHSSSDGDVSHPISPHGTSKRNQMITSDNRLSPSSGNSFGSKPSSLQRRSVRGPDDESLCISPTMKKKQVKKSKKKTLPAAFDDVSTEDLAAMLQRQQALHAQQLSELRTRQDRLEQMHMEQQQLLRDWGQLKWRQSL